MSADVNIAEALYRVRCLQLRKPKGLRSELSGLEHELRAALMELGHDPGETAEDADTLKIHLMFPTDAASEHQGKLEQTLEELADRYGSGCVFRQLERFTLFCSRMRFAEPGSELVEDDPELPVYAWCRADGRTPAADLSEAAQLHKRWYQQAMRLFREKVEMKGSDTVVLRKADRAHRRARHDNQGAR
jgi:hypothetical protein